MCYHAINRGNARAEVFHKEDDYAAFVRLVAEACERLPMQWLLTAQVRYEGNWLRWVNRAQTPAEETALRNCIARGSPYGGALWQRLSEPAKGFRWSGSGNQGKISRTRSLGGQIDVLCDRFEAAWKAGQRLKIEDCLGQLPRERRGRLLRDAQGHARITDSGLAVHESGQRRLAGECSGTPAYMAPEQVRGEVHRLDGRADVWALGVILYELLTGRRPFGGEILAELRDEILSREPKPPRQIDEAVPEALERACLKCLAKDVTARYATAGDLARDLRRYLRPKRFPALALPVGIGAVLVAALLFTAWLVAWMMRGPRTDSSATGPVAQTPASDPLDGRLDVLIWSSADKNRRGLRLREPSALPLRANDQIRVQVELSRPAYVYMLRIDDPVLKTQQAIASTPKAQEVLRELQATAQQLAQLTLAVPKPEQREARQKRLADLNDKKERLEEELAQVSHEFRRSQEVAEAKPEGLARLLPQDAAVVEFYRADVWNPPPGGKGKLVAEAVYDAFVLRRGNGTGTMQVAWVQLGPVKPIDDAAAAWRAAITGKRTGEPQPVSCALGCPAGSQAGHLPPGRLRPGHRPQRPPTLRCTHRAAEFPRQAALGGRGELRRGRSRQ